MDLREPELRRFGVHQPQPGPGGFPGHHRAVVQGAPVLCVVRLAIHWNSGRNDSQIFHPAGLCGVPKHARSLSQSDLHVVVDAEWVRARRNCRLRLADGFPGPRDADGHLHAAGQDEPLGSLGDARLHLPPPTRLAAARAGLVGLGKSALPLPHLRGCRVALRLRGRGAWRGRLVLHHDHPRQQVVRLEGLLHLPDLSLFCFGFQPLAGTLPRHCLRERLQPLRQCQLGRAGERQRLLQRCHLLGCGALGGCQLCVPTDGHALLQQRHPDLQGTRQSPAGRLSHRLRFAYGGSSNLESETPPKGGPEER
mmetsp:Transcript_45406/g.72111  ORF Transcript_45406/g.72111 Transcript_45406/m.72111 type:complete len:309 (+) Transcript_45406:1072-1998(+)